MTDVSRLFDLWTSLWTRIHAVTRAEESFAELAQTYASPHRAYHNLGHIEDCLSQFSPVQDQVENCDAVELAIWMHDVIYDPQSTTNEADSAAWSDTRLNQAELPGSMARDVRRVILATKHDRTLARADEKWMVDIDLSILGRDEPTFREYDRRIREEYSFVPSDAYRVGRSKVLQSFLDRDCIFATTYFRTRYEHVARENLTRAIRDLSY